MDYWLDLIWVGNTLYPRWLVYGAFLAIGLLFGLVAHFIVRATA